MNTKGSGCFRRLFIYLFIFLFYFILFFVRGSLECKDVEDLGSISVYQAASFWTVYFSPGTRSGSDHDKFTTEYNRPIIP